MDDCRRPSRGRSPQQRPTTTTSTTTTTTNDHDHDQQRERHNSSGVISHVLSAGVHCSPRPACNGVISGPCALVSDDESLNPLAVMNQGARTQNLDARIVRGSQNLLSERQYSRSRAGDRVRLVAPTCVSTCVESIMNNQLAQTHARTLQVSAAQVTGSGIIRPLQIRPPQNRSPQHRSPQHSMVKRQVVISRLLTSMLSRLLTSTIPQSLTSLGLAW